MTRTNCSDKMHKRGHTTQCAVCTEYKTSRQLRYKYVWKKLVWINDSSYYVDKKTGFHQVGGTVIPPCRQLQSLNKVCDKCYRNITSTAKVFYFSQVFYFHIHFSNIIFYFPILCSHKYQFWMHSHFLPNIIFCFPFLYSLEHHILYAESFSLKYYIVSV